MDIRVESNFFDLDSYSQYTPDDLRFIASMMEDQGVKSVGFEFDSGYNNLSIEEFCIRPENEAEEKARLKKEEKQKIEANKFKRKQKIKLIKDALKSGLDVRTEPLETDYSHVYFIVKGTEVQNWIAPKTGYIWFDEAGLLGREEVFSTAKKANEDLGRYVREVLND